MKTVCFVLQDIGKNIYTLKDVVDEIRDKPTRRSLSFLPYQLNFKEPHPEHIRKGNCSLKTQNILPQFLRSRPDSRESDWNTVLRNRNLSETSTSSPGLFCVEYNSHLRYTECQKHLKENPILQKPCFCGCLLF